MKMICLIYEGGYYGDQRRGGQGIQGRVLEVGAGVVRGGAGRVKGRGGVRIAIGVAKGESGRGGKAVRKTGVGVERKAGRRMREGVSNGRGGISKKDEKEEKEQQE